MRNLCARGILSLSLCAALPASAADLFTRGGANKVPALRETSVNGAPGETTQGVTIWAAPNKANSRIIGAQPQGEIDLYDLNGVIVQRLGLKAPGAVDVRDNFYWVEGEGAILAATDNSDHSIALYKIDPKTGMASNAPRGRIRTMIKQMAGVCLGRVGADQILVAAGKAGDVHIWTLAVDPWKEATGIKLGALSVGSEVSSCAIDDKTGALYLAETNRGIWRMDLSDQTFTQRVLVDSWSTEGHLKGPVNALTIWNGDGYGLLLASSGTNASVSVYDRGAKNHYWTTLSIGAAKRGGADAVKGGLGIAAAGGDFGAEAPLGLIVIQDSENTKPKAASNYKIVSFADIEKRIPFE